MAPVQLVKVSDEGTASPFIARIFFGVLVLRDQLFLLGFPDEERPRAQDHFDRKFQPLLDAVQATRDAALEVVRLVHSHREEITSGAAVHFRPGQYDVLHTINSPLSQAVDKLIDQSIVATKGGLQSILSDPLGLNIGFFFQQDPSFRAAVSSLRAANEDSLAKYLEDVRTTWHESLQALRDQHEHHGWSLARVTYALVAPSQVGMFLPEVLGVPVNVFAAQTANRVLLFVENMMAYAFQRLCRWPINVVEIPEESRDPRNAERFRLVPRGLDPSPPWEIDFRDNMDFVRP